jgi:hypothetical protein
MRYVTYEEAVQIHLEHFLARPKNTKRNIWFIRIPIWLRWRPALKFLISRIQPLPRLCPDHLALGYTDEMYETVRELNIRKNTALYLAWMVANEVSDEDLQWANLGSNKPIPVKQLVNSQITFTTELDERIKSLSTVLPPLTDQWEIKHPSGEVQLQYLRDWLPSNVADAIQTACDSRFGPGKVQVV